MTDADVVIIGAGPAGATVAAVLAGRGFRVVILDRGTQPAPHLPETWLVDDIDLLAELGVSGVVETFVERTEVRFFDKAGVFGLRLAMECLNRGDGPPVVRLDRSAFDALLVRHAQERGASYVACAGVTAVGLGSARPFAECQTPEGPRRFAGRVVVDASGKSAVIGSQLGLLSEGDRLDPRTALFAHFTGGAFSDLLPGGAMGIVSLDDGYAFMIPLTDDRVSVGVVVDDHAGTAAGADLEGLFAAQVASSRLLSDALHGATQVLPVIPARNRAYVCTRFAGPDWFVVGEAAAFRDPFLSDGVTFAVRNGLLAADAVVRNLNATATEQRQTIGDEYSLVLHDLLDAGQRQVEAALDGPAYRQFLRSCADPHLPPFIPAALLVAVGAPPMTGAGVRSVMGVARAAFATSAASATGARVR